MSEVVELDDFKEDLKLINQKLNTLTKDTVLNENEIPYIIDEKYEIDIDTREDFKKAQKVM